MILGAEPQGTVLRTSQSTSQLTGQSSEVASPSTVARLRPRRKQTTPISTPTPGGNAKEKLKNKMLSEIKRLRSICTDKSIYSSKQIEENTKLLDNLQRHTESMNENTKEKK